MVVDPAAQSIRKMAQLMSSARVIFGVHGGQMANLLFANPDKGTAVIEIVGRQSEYKSYYYAGFMAPLDYHYVPRLCLFAQGKRAAVRHAWGKPVRGSTTPGMCGKSTFVYASLDDVWNALGSIFGKVNHPSCVQPKLPDNMEIGGAIVRDLP